MATETMLVVAGTCRLHVGCVPASFDLGGRGCGSRRRMALRGPDELAVGALRGGLRMTWRARCGDDPHAGFAGRGREDRQRTTRRPSSTQQIQALDRTAPMLPACPSGAPTTMSATTTLFAALNIDTGTVTAHCQPRHRHQEFLPFLKPGGPRLPQSRVASGDGQLRRTSASRSATGSRPNREYRCTSPRPQRRG
jgi:hypothetical protein